MGTQGKQPLHGKYDDHNLVEKYCACPKLKCIGHIFVVAAALAFYITSS